MGKVKHIAKQSQLIEAVMRNDEQTLRSLYTQNYYKTEKYVLQNSGSKPQAKDIYQEAFITVWKNVKAGKFVPKNDTALQGYLFQISKNKWLDVLRSSQYRKTRQLDTNYLNVHEDENAMDTVEEKHTKEKQQQLIVKAFSQLGKDCRRLLEAFYFEKQSMRNISSLFEITEASARNKKYRCIERLRELTNLPPS